MSAISGDLALDDSPSDPRAGTYTLHGLTPGAQYAVFIDGILDGGFSTMPHPVPGPEEFFNARGGERRSRDGRSPELRASGRGRRVHGGGTDIVVNRPAPGPLVLGDEDSLEIFPHFKVAFCGIEYDSFFINSNGHVTFGAPAPLFASSAHKVGFLMGEPGIAGLYADLDPTAGGTVSFDETANDVTVRFEDVPRAGQAAARTRSRSGSSPPRSRRGRRRTAT